MEFEQHCKGNEERLDRLQKDVLVAKQLYDEYVKLPISDRHYQSMEGMVEPKQRVNELEEERVASKYIMFCEFIEKNAFL